MTIFEWCRLAMNFLYAERKKENLFTQKLKYEEIKHIIGLSEYDGIRKMLNINCKGKAHSKSTAAKN